MILSASGWRKIFTESGDGEDSSPSIGQMNTLLVALIAQTFAEYISTASGKRAASIAVGRDTRPTGKAIADTVLRVLLGAGLDVHYLDITAAPEIMAYARNIDGFLYISASHNPVGHNGIKFGLNDGGVLPGSEVKKLIASFEEKCAFSNAEERAARYAARAQGEALDAVYQKSPLYKKVALQIYEDFIRTAVTGTNRLDGQDAVFNAMELSLEAQPLSVVCDMNGSARTLSIDKAFFTGCGIGFIPFNSEPGEIAHEIIPEPENLVQCADRMQQLRQEGDTSVLLGYMPDCDGDRGNIVYWNEKTGEADVVAAQEGFALCVLAESAFSCWKDDTLPQSGLLSKANKFSSRRAVVVNCPTSMRIEDICSAFGIELFRVEVGEANVVELARQKRNEGYEVRIIGEGSNGGNITWPSSVRDPVATVFAIIKLLTLRDSTDANGTVHKGLFHIWCEKSDQLFKYKEDFTVADILDTLPAYTTTGVSEPRATLKISTQDKGLLKARFQKIFTEEWASHKDELEAIYGFHSYEADLTNGTKERRNAADWNNGTGGLKIRFLDDKQKTRAFIWMRPSGTEPVFRILCDVKDGDDGAERSLLRWESAMLTKADAAED